MIALELSSGVKLRRDRPVPRPQRGESLVAVRYAGICGTDLQLARGYMNFQGIPGHEFVGDVVESADRELLGARVVGEINAGCGRCESCRNDQARHCQHRTVLGILGRGGAFAEYLTLPDHNLLRVPPNVEDQLAVFTEPVAAAYEITDQIRLRPTDDILILGDGRLGAIVALVLKTEGHSPLVAGHHPEKLGKISQLGLSTAHEPELPSKFFDVVIDCTGSATGLGRALELTKPRGTVVLKSTAASRSDVDLAPLVVNEITVVGSRCGRFGPALSAIESGKLDLRPLISGVYSLEQAPAALKAARQPSNFKILLRCPAAPA